MIRLIPPEEAQPGPIARARRAVRAATPIATAALLVLVVGNALWHLPSARGPSYPILREPARVPPPAPVPPPTPVSPATPVPPASVSPPAAVAIQPAAPAPAPAPPPEEERVPPRDGPDVTPDPAPAPIVETPSALASRVPSPPAPARSPGRRQPAEPQAGVAKSAVPPPPRVPSRVVEAPPVPPPPPRVAERRPPGEPSPRPATASAAAPAPANGSLASRPAVPVAAPPPAAPVEPDPGPSRPAIPGAPGGGGASVVALLERGTPGRAGSAAASRPEAAPSPGTVGPLANGAVPSTAPPAPRLAAAPQTVAAVVAPALVSVRARGRGGAGFVVDADGYIVTSNRLVSGTGAIEVTFPDGRTLPVTLIGRDPLSDVAVLKVEARGLRTVRLGSSSGLRVGDPVMAVGKRRGQTAELTLGTLRATGSATGGDLAMDVPVVPDAAGGPLLNARGEVVGVAMAGGSRVGPGAGQAVPIDRVKPMLRDLKRAAPAPPPAAATPSDR